MISSFLLKCLILGLSIDYGFSFNLKSGARFEERLLRVEYNYPPDGPTSSMFTPKIKKLLPHYYRPPPDASMSDTMKNILSVPCSGSEKDRCKRSQHIFWVEENYKIAKEFAFRRENDKLAGETDGVRRNIIIYSTTQNFFLPPQLKDYPDGKLPDVKDWKLTGHLKVAEAHFIDIILVFSQEIAHAFNSAAHIHLKWIRAWPRPFNHSKLDVEGEASVTVMPSTLDAMADAKAQASDAFHSRRHLMSQVSGGRHLSGVLTEIGNAVRALDGAPGDVPAVIQPYPDDVPSIYIASVCGSRTSCALRDWSTLLLSLNSVNTQRKEHGKPPVLLKIAIRVKALVTSTVQMTSDAVRDCTPEAHCELTSLSGTDYQKFVKAAAMFVLPLSPSVTPGVGLATLVDSLSNGVPVMSSDIPTCAGYIRHGFNGVLITADTAFQAANGFTLELKKLFGEVDNEPGYTLESLRANTVAGMGNYTEEVAIESLKALCAPAMHRIANTTTAISATRTKKLEEEAKAQKEGTAGGGGGGGGHKYPGKKKTGGSGGSRSKGGGGSRSKGGGRSGGGKGGGAKKGAARKPPGGPKPAENIPVPNQGEGDYNDPVGTEKPAPENKPPEPEVLSFDEPVLHDYQKPQEAAAPEATIDTSAATEGGGGASAARGAGGGGGGGGGKGGAKKGPKQNWDALVPDEVVEINPEENAGAGVAAGVGNAIPLSFEDGTIGIVQSPPPPPPLDPSENLTDISIDESEKSVPVWDLPKEHELYKTDGKDVASESNSTDVSSEAAEDSTSTVAGEGDKPADSIPGANADGSSEEKPNPDEAMAFTSTMN